MPKAKKEKRGGGRLTRKEEDRLMLGNLFPKAVTFLKEVLTDRITNADGTPLLTKDGKQVVASVAQKLDVAFRVVDQHIGKPAQAVDLTQKNESPPATHTVIVKNYQAVPVEEQIPEVAQPEVFKEWIDEVEFPVDAPPVPFFGTPSF